MRSHYEEGHQLNVIPSDCFVSHPQHHVMARHIFAPLHHLNAPARGPRSSLGPVITTATALSSPCPWAGAEAGRATKRTEDPPHLLRTKTTPFLQFALRMAFQVCELLVHRTQKH